MSSLTVLYCKTLFALKSAQRGRTHLRGATLFATTLYIYKDIAVL